MNAMTCRTCSEPIDFQREYSAGPFLVGRNGFVHLDGALGHEPFPKPVRLAHTAWKPGAYVTVTAVGEVVLEVLLPDGMVSSFDFEEPAERDAAFADKVGEYLDHGYQAAA